MFNFTKRYVNSVSLVISLIIFCFLNTNILSVSKLDSKNFFISNQVLSKIETMQKAASNFNKSNDVKETKKANTKENKVKKSVNWQIEIPAIKLNAPIAEGTTLKVMDEYIGHFEETPKDEGNIALAAHNRGYKVNYFQNLKKLKEGDNIIYKYKGKQIKYSVTIHKIIKDTDWSLLENTKENRITLITCVENQPEYRRCIQAVEITKNK